MCITTSFLFHWNACHVLLQIWFSISCQETISCLEWSQSVYPCFCQCCASRNLGFCRETAQPLVKTLQQYLHFCVTSGSSVGPELLDVCLPECLKMKAFLSFICTLLESPFLHPWAARLFPELLPREGVVLSPPVTKHRSQAKLNAVSATDQQIDPGR